MTTNSKASATAGPTATTATVSALPSSGGHSLSEPITLVAVLVLVGSGVTALGPLRRAFSQALDRPAPTRWCRHFPRAQSSDLLWNGQVLFVSTTEGRTNPVSKLLSPEQPLGL